LIGEDVGHVSSVYDVKLHNQAFFYILRLSKVVRCIENSYFLSFFLTYLLAYLLSYLLAYLLWTVVVEEDKFNEGEVNVCCHICS